MRLVKYKKDWHSTVFNITGRQQESYMTWGAFYKDFYKYARVDSMDLYTKFEDEQGR